jgi:hypothetical protein
MTGWGEDKGGVRLRTGVSIPSLIFHYERFVYPVHVNLLHEKEKRGLGSVLEAGSEIRLEQRFSA